MELIVSKITGYCIKNNIITVENEAWLKYGIEKRLSTFIGTIPFTILAIYLTNIPAALSFLVAFKLLRQKISGYHSKTVLGCMCVSLLFELLFLGVIYQCLDLEASMGVDIICCMIVFSLAPYDHPNMNFSEEEILVLRQNARKAVLMLSILTLICYCNTLSSIAKGLTTGIAMAAFMLCLAYYIDWRNNQ